MFNRVRDGVRRLFGLKIHDARLARADAEAELREYLRARVEQLMQQGMTPDAANAEALRRLGGSFERALDDAVRSARKREQELSLREYLGDLKDDLRFAVRSFRREKLFAAFIVVTLALGIGANAAMYAVIDRLLIRGPEHIDEPNRVVRVYRRTHDAVRGDITTSAFGWVTYDVLRKEPKAFAGIAATSTRTLLYGSGSSAVLLPVGAVSWDMFPMLGVKTRIGRWFDAKEDDTSAPQRVAVISFRIWQRDYGSAEDVVGKTITLGPITYTIVGVAPKAFTGPSLAPIDAWIPLSLASQGTTTNWPGAWNAQWVRLYARLAPGASAEQAATAATAAYRGAYGGNEPGGKEAVIFTNTLASNARGVESNEARISRWLIGVTVTVLLIACSNVTNLLLARAMRRRRELAVRIALGAGRGRLVRLLLTESTMLAMAGAAAGLLVAWGTAVLMRDVLIPGIEWPTAPVDLRVLAISLGIATGVGLITGLVPMLRATRPDLAGALKAGAREGGGQSSRLRAGLTIAQAALSIVLLVGAGLFVRSLAKVRGIDLGIEPERVLVVQVRYPSNPAPVTLAGGGSGAASAARSADAAELARRKQVLHAAMARARTLASVEQASLNIGLSFQSAFGQFQKIAGMDSIPAMRGGSVNVSAATEGYFETVGTRILEGRGFTATDRDGSEPVTVVSKTMATGLWPGRSPLGECVYWSQFRDSLYTCARIVGVAADANSSAIREEAHMQYYLPWGQERGMGGTSLLLRPRPEMEAEAIAGIRKALLEIDPSISYVSASLLSANLESMIRPWRVGAAMFSLMGLLALVVAAVGLYSVMSYLVAQRTQEMGVRIALGASGGNIVMLILRTSAGMAAAGIVIGLATAVATGRFIEPLLFETSSRDPLVIGGVSVLLLSIAVLASVVPAMRAKRVDPLEALRAE